MKTWHFLISSTAWRGNPPKTSIETIRNAGFAGVELQCEIGHFEYNAPTHVQGVQEALGNWPEATVTIHAPFCTVDLGADDPEDWNHAMREMDKVMELAKRYNAQAMVFHARQIDRTYEWSEANRVAFEKTMARLLPVATAQEMKIAIENMPPDNLPPGRFLIAPDELQDLLEPYPPESVGVCIDTGHAHLSKTLPAFADLFASRTVVLHIHDNCGNMSDNHWIPGQGSISWKPFVEAMLSGGFAGIPVLEVVPKEGLSLEELLEETKGALQATGLTALDKPSE